MWVANNPEPDDFCGQPPCPHCYHWADEPSDGAVVVDGLEKMSQDLLRKDLASLTEAERLSLDSLADQIHQQGLPVAAEVVPEDTPPPAQVDIGMSLTKKIERTLQMQRPRGPVIAPRRRELTTDEIADRQAAREQITAEQEKEKEAVKADLIAKLGAIAEVSKAERNKKYEELKNKEESDTQKRAQARGLEWRDDTFNNPLTPAIDRDEALFNKKWLWKAKWGGEY